MKTVSTPPQQQPIHQRGVALIMVLVILATISLLAIEVNDRTLFNTQRTLNRVNAEQAHWYMHGGAQLAQQQLEQALKSGPGAIMTLVNSPMQHYPVGQLDDKARISLQIRSGHTCFNLNSLAPGPNQLDNQQSFNALLAALNISEPDRQQLSDRLLDWLDPDSQARPQGAENNDYLSLNSYSADTLLTSLAVLPQLWPEYLAQDTSEAYNKQTQSLMSLLCVHPGDLGLSINIDHLKPEQAVLISAISKGKIPQELARKLVEMRPDEGYISIQTLLESPEVKHLDLKREQLNTLRFDARWFIVEIAANNRNSTIENNYLIEDKGNKSQIIKITKKHN